MTKRADRILRALLASFPRSRRERSIAPAMLMSSNAFVLEQMSQKEGMAKQRE